MPEGGRLADRLAVRAGGWTCLLEVGFVLETMRPLPIAPVSGVGAAVRGVSVVRGHPVPIVDLEMLLGGKSTTPPRRLVTVAALGRTMGFLVSEVLGLRSVSLDSAAQDDALVLLPSLETVTERLGVADGALLAVLAPARLIEEHGA
jgi:purine-binding chemotaxis protein CheW